MATNKYPITQRDGWTRRSPSIYVRQIHGRMIELHRKETRIQDNSLIDWVVREELVNGSYKELYKASGVPAAKAWVAANIQAKNKPAKSAGVRITMTATADIDGSLSLLSAIIDDLYGEMNRVNDLKDIKFKVAGLPDGMEW